MVKKQIVWTDNSIKELENILEYYIQRNKSINFSSWLLDEVEKRIEIISIYPKIGRALTPT